MAAVNISSYSSGSHDGLSHMAVAYIIQRSEMIIILVMTLRQIASIVRVNRLIFGFDFAVYIGTTLNGYCKPSVSCHQDKGVILARYATLHGVSITSRLYATLRPIRIFHWRGCSVVRAMTTFSAGRFTTVTGETVDFKAMGSFRDGHVLTRGRVASKAEASVGVAEERRRR